MLASSMPLQGVLTTLGRSLNSALPRRGFYRRRLPLRGGSGLQITRLPNYSITKSVQFFLDFSLLIRYINPALVKPGAAPVSL